MTAQYDANNPDNWINIYSNSFEATYIQGKQVPIYTPIPKTNLNLNIDSPILAIYSESNQYPNSRRYVGRVYQSILGNNIFPSPTLRHKGKSIYSNETIFLEFTQFDDNYDLTLDVYWKVEQLAITIFKYVGSINTNLETKINTIENKIDQLQEKLDQYFSENTTEVAIQQEQNFGAVSFTNII